MLPALPSTSFGKPYCQLQPRPRLKQKEIQLQECSKVLHTNKHISPLLLSNHRTPTQKQHSKSLIRDLMSCGKILLFILSYLFSVLSEVITQSTTEPHRQPANSQAKAQARLSTQAPNSTRWLVALALTWFDSSLSCTSPKSKLD